MNICLPVEQANGLDSRISPNLRSTPALLIVDSENGRISGIDTSSGVCGAIPGDIDALVFAGGIGRGMFNGLQRQGIRIFATDADTVGNALAQLAAGTLQEVGEAPKCSGGQPADHAPGSCGCGNHGQENNGPAGTCGCQH